MEIQGFKSFAEHVNVEFHNGITCIVGPNGSGKSNISDALKWVLGEQSPKSLRGNRMEDVIFSGTSTRKSRGMAEVTLIIDNSSDILPIDFTEVAITRRMYRSGESEYYINNNICRLKDIRELIMDTGIGVDGYSIIGQGKIMEIINSKPDERRKIFEEVAGIVKYRTKKSEAERKLNSTNLNLLRVNDIIYELESRIEPLREESEKAKEYISLKERIKTIEINLTLRNIEIIESRMSGYKDELDSLNKEIREIESKKKDLDKTVIEYKDKKEHKEESIQTLQDSCMNLFQEINEAENQKKINEEKFSAFEKDLSRLQSEIIALDGKIEIENNTIDNLRKKKADIESSLEQFAEQEKIKVSQYNNLHNKLAEQADMVESEKGKVFELYNTITAKKTEIASIDGLKNSLAKRKRQILDEQENKKNQNIEVINRYNELLREKKLSDEKLEDLEKEQNMKKEVLNENRSIEGQMTEELAKIKNHIDETSARYGVLKDMENDFDGYNHAVKKLLKNMDNSNGIHGVVADLIEVPEGFEVAMETALGGALQNIICQNDVSAKCAVDFLKKNKGGRLTFLPIDTIKTYRKTQKEAFYKMSGFKGFAVECIKYDSVYTDIMEYLLGRVIIVNNLENAIRMSKKANQNIRIVTMDGDTINSSGAITGGSYKKSTGSILVRKAEAKKLNQQIVKYKKEYNNLNEKIREKRNKIKEITESLNELDNSNKEIQADIIFYEKEMHKFENDIQLFSDNEKKWENEKRDIENEELKTIEMMKCLREDIASLQVEVDSIEKDTQNHMKRYDDDKLQLDEMTDAITDLKMKKAALDKDASNITENIQRIEKYINEITLEKQNKIKTIEEIKTSRAFLKNNYTETEDTIVRKRQEKETLETEIKGLIKEKESVSKELDICLSNKEKMDRDIYNFQMKKHDMDIKITKSETQIDSLKDKLWDEFEISYIQAIEVRKKDFKYTSEAKDAKEIKEKLKKLGEVNISAVKEYETVKERFDFLMEQRKDLLDATESLNSIIEDMDKTIKINFKESFIKVADLFESIFKDLFGGGTAELRMDDKSNLLETGIEIVAQPPGKKLQSISLLSGGEKTLTAIALMFSILKVKPTPFCILDEVEAALDDTNINRFAGYLKKFDNIQFVLVTHQKATMEFADILYGVTMPEQGISKVLSLKLEEKAG